MTENVVNLTRAPTPVEGPYKIDPRRGTSDGRVSSQWFSRPDDERFLDLPSLHAMVRHRADNSWVDNVDTKSIGVESSKDDLNKLTLVMPNEERVSPTHWSFTQLCQQIDAPAKYLRALPGPLAAANVAYGLTQDRTEQIKVFATRYDDRQELRAITSPTYGRILDAEVVEAVMRVANDEWKVPGVIDWRNMTYDPNAPVTKRSTTLYASDRDVFLFLCRDRFPIEIGKLPDGSPDYLIPGFVGANSETGSKSFFFEMMFFRGLCQNRNMWGVETDLSIRLRHNKFAPQRFAAEAAPVLEQFVQQASRPVIEKVNAAKSTIVAKDEDGRKEFLLARDFSRKAVSDILAQHLEMEGHPADSVWDMTQAITAWARDIPHQDDRFTIEKRAGRLMDAVKV